MVKKSKLLLALDAHRGRDYDAEKKKKQLKAAEKQKRRKTEAKSGGITHVELPMSESIAVTEVATVGAAAAAAETDEVEWESEPEEDEEDVDEEEDGAAAKVNGNMIPQPTDPAADDDGDDDASASASQESDVALSDLEHSDLEDTIPHQRLTINNGAALAASTKRVTVAQPSMPFHHHNSLISALPPSSEAITDPNDDLTRELEFYRIAKDAAVTARSILRREKIPFTRPADYFAEMVKSDEHMGKVKKKMYDDAAGKKASDEARKLRDARKFGKAVQIAKEQERAREKKGTLDQIKELKRKRKGQPSDSVNEADDLFQEIAVERTPNKDRSGRERGTGTGTGKGAGGPPSAKRQKRDAKFGFGGKKRFSKSGDAVSSGDMSGFSASGMKGRGGKGAGGGGGGGGGGRNKKKVVTTKRLGKSRRATSGR